MATQRGRWMARPLVAGLIRALVVIVPAVAGALASWEVSRIWEQPSGLRPVVGWFLTLVAVAVVVATAVATVAALVLAGAVGGGDGQGEPAAARTQGARSAAPQTPAAPPATDAPATAPPASEAGGTTVSSGPAAARPGAPIDKVLAGVVSTVTTPTTAPPALASPPTSAPPSAEPPSPPAPASPPPARPFSAQGQLVALDLLGRIGIGLTKRGPVGGCSPSGSQGLDAWVFELPSDAPGPGAPVKATGTDLLGLHNLAATFVSEDCKVVGELDTPAADEAGVLPVGTRFVVVSDRLGIGTRVTLTVG